jgi:hypothetical protein
LIALLRTHLKKQPTGGDELVFLTRKGRPIVTRGSDAVRQAFDDWRVMCAAEGRKIRKGVTFYSLRRFFGDYATRVGGDAVGDAALAYTAKSVRGKHYSGYRDFARSERRVGVCTRN